MFSRIIRTIVLFGSIRYSTILKNQIYSVFGIQTILKKRILSVFGLFRLFVTTLLQAQKADLVVADITITYEREQGVDFTMPFMNLGVTILYKKPTKKDPNLFSFLSPLSFDVWIYIITAYLAVSLLLFTISRFVFLSLRQIIISLLRNDIIDNFRSMSPDSVLMREASRKLTATIWQTARDYG